MTTERVSNTPRTDAVMGAGNMECVFSRLARELERELIELRAAQKASVPIGWLSDDDAAFLERDGECTIYQKRQAFRILPSPIQIPLYASAPPAEDAGLRKDAEQYRWLKDHAMWINCSDDDSESGNFALGEADDEIVGALDAAIDAALSVTRRE